MMKRWVTVVVVASVTSGPLACAQTTARGDAAERSTAAHPVLLALRESLRGWMPAEYQGALARVDLAGTAGMAERRLLYYLADGVIRRDIAPMVASRDEGWENLQGLRPVTDAASARRAARATAAAAEGRERFMMELHFANSEQLDSEEYASISRDTQAHFNLATSLRDLAQATVDGRGAEAAEHASRSYERGEALRSHLGEAGAPMAVRALSLLRALASAARAR